MTFDEMVAKVLPIFPDAIFDEDEIGELVISTVSNCCTHFVLGRRAGIWW